MADSHAALPTDDPGDTHGNRAQLGANGVLDRDHRDPLDRGRAPLLCLSYKAPEELERKLPSRGHDEVGFQLGPVVRLSDR